MVGTLKEITENYENEKLAKIQMIKIILSRCYYMCMMLLIE